MTTFSTLLRKDVLLFWPFAGLTAVLFALAQVPPLVSALGPVAGLLQMGMQFGLVLLTLVVCYEDAVVSARHDWLTRPIAGTTMLAEKATFIFLALVLPSILGALAYELWQGHSIAEAVVAAVGAGASGGLLIGLTIIMAFAAVTANIRQAFIVFLSAIAVLSIVAVSAGQVIRDGDPVGTTASAWTLTSTLPGVMLIAAVSVLWVQYRHRHTRSARVIAGAALLAGVAIVATMNWSRAFAVQRLLAPEADAPEGLAERALTEGCFPARRLNAHPEFEASTRLESRQPVTFATRLTGVAGNPDRLVVVDFASVDWTSRGHRETRLGRASRLDRGAITGLSPASELQWVVPDEEYRRVAALGDLQTRVRYSLSVLAPTRSVELVADGRRSHATGIGWCGATLNGAGDTVDVDCYAAGPQAALLTANLAGAPAEAAIASRAPDYTPAPLELWGGVRHRMALPYRGADTPRLTVTAYEARAHFDHAFTRPGLLGGTSMACPGP